jgi:hypothetical protein
VFAAEQEKLKAERRAAKRLQAVASAQLDDAHEALDIALNRLDKIAQVYRDGTPLERRILNQAIFERIDIGPDGQATGTVLTPVYEAISAWRPRLGQPKTPKNTAKSQDGPLTAQVQPCPVSSHFPLGNHSRRARLRCRASTSSTRRSAGSTRAT